MSSQLIEKENLQNSKVLTNSFKTHLTNRSAGLYERLNLMSDIPTGWEATPEALERLESWRKMVEVGVGGQFEQRLSLDNLDLAKITYALSDDFRLPGDALGNADWLNLVEECLAENASVRLDLQMLAENAALPYSFIEATNPVMFEEALAGFVRVAGRKLRERAGKAFSMLSFTAQRQLEFSLLSDIAVLTTNVLCEEFLNFRLNHSPALLFSPVPASQPARKIYRRFVEELLAGGWLNLLDKYSILARLLGILLNDWLVATTEVLQRLEADFKALQQTFRLSTPRLARYNSSVSDAHNGHRDVVVLTFEDGTKLVYKPRNLGAEEAFDGWLNWLNEQNMALDLKTYRILNRNNYGWVEFVEAKPCENESQVADFYRRCGMLLAVFYLLGTTDCHQENIIACGAYPVMIDAEAVLSYRLQADSGDGEASLEYETLDESVLRTHLLPFWGKTPMGGYADYSGLSLGRTTTSQTYSTRTWEHINTDYLRKVTREITTDATEPFDNVPRLHGKPVSPAPYLPQIVAGFEEVYLLFMSQNTATADSLAVFDGREIRLIFRATQLYASLLYNSYHPSMLKNGVDRSLDLDILSRGLLTPENRRFWALLEVERNALERGDIPLFSGLSDSTDLELADGGKLANFSRFSACEMVQRRLARLNETDLAQQLRFIRNSFYTVMTNLQEVRAAVSASVPTTNTEPADPTMLINEARRIAETLRQEAIGTKNGGLNWVAPELVPDGKVYAYKGLGYSLYSGTSGVALFLAALYRVTGDVTYREMSLRALQNIRDLTRNRVGLSQLARFTGIGGSFGLGSLIYSFVRAGQLLDEPALLDEAEVFAGQITPDLIAADRTFDPMLGSSGAIMSLLALHAARPAKNWLEIAAACGQHLMAHRLTPAEGVTGWATFAASPTLAVSGFAHGASGIGLALARLGEVSGNSHFQTVAQEAFALENTRFDAGRQNWASYLVENDPEPYFGIAWCHGAVGIGLSRLALSQTAATGQEIQTALATTQQAGLHSFDQLCCGTAGRIELLVTASQKLQRPDLLTTARAWANQIVQNAHKNDGNYRFFANVPLEVSSPGLFQGITGVGYELLRVANPALVPSVAIWE